MLVNQFQKLWISLHYFKGYMILLQVLLCIRNGLKHRVSYILGNLRGNFSERLCDTRWVCRVVACRNIRNQLDALVYMLVLLVIEDVAGRG